MQKIRIHELAKELNVSNKDIMDTLSAKGVEVKSHMMALDEAQEKSIREKYSPKKPAPSREGEAKKGERGTIRPKKKNLIQVVRPQNAKTQEGRNFRGAPAPTPRPENRKPQPKPVSAEAKEEKKKPQAAAEATLAAPAPAPAPVKEAPAAEVKPAAVKPEPVKEAPVKETAVKEASVKEAPAKEQPAQTAAPAEEAPKKPRFVPGTIIRRETVPPKQEARPARNTQDRNGNDRRNQGERRPFNKDGERRPFNRDNNNGQRSFGNDRRNDGERRPFNKDGERRPFNRDGNTQQGRNQGDRRPAPGGAGRMPFNKDKDGDTQRKPFERRTPDRKPAMGGDMGLAKKPSREGRKEKDKEREKASQRENKMTNDRKSGSNRPNQGKNRLPLIPKALQKQNHNAPKKEAVVEAITEVKLPEKMTIRELAEAIKKQPSELVKKLFMQGMMVTVNQEIDFEKASEICLEYEIIAEEEEKVDVIAELLKEAEEDEETMTERPPVVCVMGHVDHGKTSLLDAIRDTRVTDREAGGITQAIGASVVSINDRRITFLDTPGHEAFTAMRMRGANSTDIAVLVVAADDGVMPQTLEAISHARAAEVELIVAINKIDKPGANLDRVKNELAEQGLVPEDWGGSTVCVPVSAKTKEGIDDLLEMILLTADVMELKANADRKARGLVIEAKLDKGKGPVASILVQKGTLHVGDFIACGACSGKVRAMTDDMGRRVKSAGPSVPVEILGLNDVPNAGEVLVATENDKEAKNFAATFISENRNKLLEETKSRMSLDDLFNQIKEGNLKELNLIVKADVQGSVEAVKESLLKLSNEEVVVKVIHSGVGIVNESDITLAAASNAIIIGFNVKVDNIAKQNADQENVDIRLYDIIYKAIEDVEAAMKGMLDPIFEEKVIGHAEIRQIFKASGVGNIAGSYVMDGYFQRGCKVRITREGRQIFEGGLSSLKRFKDDVKEVKTGFECGLTFEGFDEIQELDMVEAYIMVEVPR